MDWLTVSPWFTGFNRVADQFGISVIRRTEQLASRFSVSAVTLVSTSSEMVNAFDPSSMDELPPTTRSIIQRRSKVLGPAYRLQYARPAEFVRGEGTWLYDADGRKYLDANKTAS